MVRSLWVGLMILASHYLIQFDLSRITIEKYLVVKQQQQLSTYFVGSKDAVILIAKDEKEQENDLTERNTLKAESIYMN